MTFADKLRELRTAAEMTQIALSRASGIPLPTIRDYEQGKREPLLSNAQRLASALGISLDVFPAPADQTKPKRKNATSKPTTKRPQGKTK